MTWPAWARYNTASTMSFTCAILPIGCNVFRKSFGSSLCIGVSTIPGATALNLMPSLAYSMAKLLIPAFSPPLVIIGTAAFAPGDRLIGERGRDAHHSAGPLIEHLLHRKLRNMEKAEEIRRHQGIEVVGCEFGKRLGEECARVRH